MEKNQAMLSSLSLIYSPFPSGISRPKTSFDPTGPNGSPAAHQDVPNCGPHLGCCRQCRIPAQQRALIHRAFKVELGEAMARYVNDLLRSKKHDGCP